MKKLLTIEAKIEGEVSVSAMCREWREDTQIFSVNDEKQAIEFIEKEDIDLIIIDLSSGYGPQIDLLGKLAYRFPFLPFVTILTKEQELVETAEENGSSLCMIKPIVPEEFKRKVLRLLDSADKGTLKGIAVYNVLQIFESEQKTCCLRINNYGRIGLIYLYDGILVGAEFDDLLNDKALYAMVTLESVNIEILHFNGQRPHQIERPLISIIMEAFRQKDERDHLEEKQQLEELSEFEEEDHSQTGSKITIEVGARLQMEVDAAGFQGMSTMIGVIPDQYLIIAAPDNFDSVPSDTIKTAPIMIKYIHMGRLCVFKTKLVDAIKSPNHLLFLVYPLVVKYHELRRAKRASIYVPCKLQTEDQDSLSGILIDLSSVGCLFMAKTKENILTPPIDLYSKVHLSCYLPGVEGNKILGGTVKNIKKTVTELRVGIEFTDLENPIKEAIDNYVITRLM